MQFVQLSVPQELYSQLGLCPNKTVVFKSSKDLCEPDIQEISANAPQSSQATSYSEEQSLKVPEVSDWSDDLEESASIEMIASFEEYNGSPKRIIVNASDIDYSEKITNIIYPRSCIICGKMSNCRSSYFKHRRVCKAKQKDRLKDRSCENNDCSDSFNDLSDEDLYDPSRELVVSVEKSNGKPEGKIANASAKYRPKKPRVFYPRPCLVCGKMSKCKPSYFKHRKVCGAMRKKHGEANKPIKKIPFVHYWENDDDDYSDSFDDLYDEELEAINNFVAQQSTDTVNDEGQETLISDASQLSSDTGNYGVEALGSDTAQLSSDTGNYGVEALGSDTAQLSTDAANDAVVNDCLNFKRKCRRICMNCGHSYANKSAFSKHLKMCDEYKRRIENPPKKRDTVIPESAIKNLTPIPDDALVNELIREEKPVKWFPVGTKICAKPSKNFKYFVVKKT